MRIGGRILQKKNIIHNDTETFLATHKGHEISVYIFRRNDNENDIFSYTITTTQNKDNTIVCSGRLQRCNILDVVIYAMNEANLR